MVSSMYTLGHAHSPQEERERARAVERTRNGRRRSDPRLLQGAISARLTMRRERLGDAADCFSGRAEEGGCGGGTAGEPKSSAAINTQSSRWTGQY